MSPRAKKKSKPARVLRGARAKSSIGFEREEKGIGPEPLSEQLDYIFKTLNSKLDRLAIRSLFPQDGSPLRARIERERWTSAIEVYSKTDDAADSSGSFVAECILNALRNDNIEELLNFR